MPRLATLLLALLCPATALAAEIPATPADYQALLGTLEPGDTLRLAPGEYPRLSLTGFHGTADAWITIAGPEDGEPAVIVGDSCCNTVELRDSSYVAIENLSIDVRGAFVDGIKAQAPTHHIRIENNLIFGFPYEQQAVGISTKATAHDWTIRGNTVLEAGTGLYLGDSNGAAPFINGVVENNLVVDPVGYCMQIKQQNNYRAPPDLSAGPHSTIIRHNVFIKDDRQSPEGDRPNLLVDGFPDSGPGADDLYEIYGNLLFYNPREALFQGAGRIAFHDNILLAAGDNQTALVFSSAQGKPNRLAHVYHNTIFGGGGGIAVYGALDQGGTIVGNVVLAGDPISAGAAVASDNITGGVADAATYFASTSLQLGRADVYPQAGQLQGAALDMSPYVAHVDYDRDYNGADKGDFGFRGAYAGEGDNPGCPLAAEVNDCTTPDDSGDSGDGGSTGGDSGGLDEGSADGDDAMDSTSRGESEGDSGDRGSESWGPVDPGTGTTGDDRPGLGGREPEVGCGCTTPTGGRAPAALLLLVLAGIRRRA